MEMISTFPWCVARELCSVDMQQFQLCVCSLLVIGRLLAEHGVISVVCGPENHDCNM